MQVNEEKYVGRLESKLLTQLVEYFIDCQVLLRTDLLDWHSFLQSKVRSFFQGDLYFISKVAFVGDNKNLDILWSLLDQIPNLLSLVSHQTRSSNDRMSLGLLSHRLRLRRLHRECTSQSIISFCRLRIHPIF